MIFNTQEFLTVSKGVVDGSSDKYGTKLKLGPTMSRIGEKVLNALVSDKDIDTNKTLIRELVTRAYMLDLIFNPNYEKDAGVFSLIPEDEKKENLTHEFTPAIGIFLNGLPLFLSCNYIEMLGADSQDELKNDITNDKVAEKYYHSSSHQAYQRAIQTLKSGGKYENVILKTKDDRTILWNSFGNVSGLEVRIGTDITVSRNYSLSYSSAFNNLGFNFETRKIIALFHNKFSSIYNNQNTTNALIAFSQLSLILDNFWNSGQFQLNLSQSDVNLPNSELKISQFNGRYAKDLGFSDNKTINDAINDGSLWPRIYSDDTRYLIKGHLDGLTNNLDFYQETFPMSVEGKIKLNSGVRFLILNTQLGIKRTFWMGRIGGISKAEAII